MESLLRAASSWEPDRAAPEGLAERALRRAGSGKSPRPVAADPFAALRGLFGSGAGGGTAWWTLGSVGAAAAATLLVTTGRLALPDVRSEMAETPAAAVAAPAPVVPAPDPLPLKPAGAKPVMTAEAPEVAAPARVAYRAAEDASPAMRRAALPRRSRGAGRMVSHTSRPPVAPVAHPVHTARSASTDAAPRSLPNNAVPLDEVQTVVPVVIAETSEDGRHVRMTPAVALSDASLAADPGEGGGDMGGMISLE